MKYLSHEFHSPLRNSLFTNEFSAKLCATFHVTKDNDCALSFFPRLNLTLESNSKLGTVEKNGLKVRSAGGISEEKGRRDREIVRGLFVSASFYTPLRLRH